MMSTSVTRAARYGAAFWAVLTAVVLLVPGTAMPLGEALPLGPKAFVEMAAHVVLFWILGWLVKRGFVVDGRGRALRMRWLQALLSYCVLLELIQIAVPFRGFQFVDVVLGFVGVFLGLGWRSRPIEDPALPYTSPPSA